MHAYILFHWYTVVCILYVLDILVLLFTRILFILRTGCRGRDT